MCDELVCDEVVCDEVACAASPGAWPDGALRWRTFGGTPPGGEALGRAALWGGALGVAAPLSPPLPAPRVVLLLVVMTSPEESAHRMGLDNLRWKRDTSSSDESARYDSNRFGRIGNPTIGAGLPWLRAHRARRRASCCAAAPVTSVQRGSQPAPRRSPRSSAARAASCHSADAGCSRCSPTRCTRRPAA